MSDTTYVYTTATVKVSNAQPGQKIVVNLVKEGTQASWSSGDPSTLNSNGITLSASGTSVPVTSFSVTSLSLTVYTSSDSSGGTLAFDISSYLSAASGVSMIGINSSSDPGVLVQFAFAGQSYTTLGTNTIFLQWA
ncbi:MAG: hypothetical protein K2P84_04010 [Undibacterium sp.]|nr:hypothetical protein [Undibacterium sp.]